MTKEEIFKEVSQSQFNEGLTLKDHVYTSMDIYAQQQAIEFFKWNALKVSEYVDYQKRVYDAEGITAKEEEVNLFEMSTIAQRYDLFLQSQQTLNNSPV